MKNVNLKIMCYNSKYLCLYLQKVTKNKFSNYTLEKINIWNQCSFKQRALVDSKKLDCLLNLILKKA